jgi:YhcH/YjgK/YiaL family protein
MIKDNLLHIDYYNYLAPGIYWGLKYLKDTDFSTMENGKYEIKEGKVWAIVQDYNSKPESEGKFEAHRKFVDIQFIVEGEEKIGVGNLEEFEEATQYDEEKDIIFLNPKEDAKVEFKKVIAGEYMILMPKDVHMPSIAVESTGFVKKVVLKVII